MIIPTKNEFIENEWLYSFYHFNQRLNERYQMCITYDMYRVFCRKAVQVVKKESKDKFIGLLVIERNWILVVKNRRTNKLMTALPFSKIYKLI